MVTILILDGKHHLTGALHSHLPSERYSTIQVQTPEEALAFILRARTDLILLDLNLRGSNGLEACRKIRLSSKAPIIAVGERGSRTNHLRAFDMGADDCMFGPVVTKELLARIRLRLRRAAPCDEISAFSTADMTIDFERRLVTVRGRHAHLPPKTFDILKYLISHRGRLVTFQALSQVIWGHDSNEYIENLRVLISHLRKVIENDSAHPKYILTEQRIGYCFQAHPEDTVLMHSENEHKAIA